MLDDVKDTEPPVPQAKCACVMAGHIIDHETGEAFVAIFCTGGNRLSVAGARILAAQIVQWADHADKHNAERPKDAIMRFMYKAADMTKVWQHVPEKVVDPNKGRERYVEKRKPYSTDYEWVPETVVPKKPRVLKRKAKRK